MEEERKSQHRDNSVTKERSVCEETVKDPVEVEFVEIPFEELEKLGTGTPEEVGKKVKAFYETVDKNRKIIGELISTNEGLRCLWDFDPDRTEHIAWKMFRGEDIYNDVLDAAKEIYANFTDYLNSMESAAVKLAAFKDYCVRINPDYSEEFELGEIWGIGSILESTAFHTKQMIAERDEEEKKWFEDHKDWIEADEKKESKQVHPVFAPILDAIKGGRA